MGHYDSQIEQHAEDQRLRKRKILKKRLDRAIGKMDIPELEAFIIAGENWQSVISVMETVNSINSIRF